MEPIHIQLCSSQCGRNEFYLRRIDETARRLGLEYCLEQVTDEAALEERGIDLDCLKGYCRAADRNTPPGRGASRMRCTRLPGNQRRNRVQRLPAGRQGTGEAAGALGARRRRKRPVKAAAHRGRICGLSNLNQEFYAL